ncbi:phospholipase D/nuclease [Aulographum hederae CBS 113979]|uniref:Phospholipase D/nuclease n=1 Tax=Aulographum hederae CBS 113979 TaxID=1176131 RepID=A0A6G1H917_9PEZI|nr:phospholipase D/nuclease [Aulographum hederae CBS 113979]
MSTFDVDDWINQLDAASQLPRAKRESPNSFYANSSSLVSSSTPLSFSIGTGESIFKTILPALEKAESDIIFVTCFWAVSPSLELLSDSLRKLSSRVLARGDGSKVRVRICFSSRSLWQKLFHTASRSGFVYRPGTWAAKLKLPVPEELGGLDLEVKSLFVKPFSVMHPKFVVVDRKNVWVPSCNVSWERWFEGCLELSGNAVKNFVAFYEEFWEQENLSHNPVDSNLSALRSLPTTLKVFSPVKIPTVFLPSPHHINPQYRLPFFSSPTPPPTPLNTFLLHLLASATSTIYIQTPNLTSTPVLDSILAAVSRGVDVHILTSERLMRLEQLVTAGRTTGMCVRSLVKAYTEKVTRNEKGSVDDRERDLEAARPLQRLGRLKTEFFQPRQGKATNVNGEEEPQQSHLKLTVVDRRVTVLGSGNMDRASWFTSQELGVAMVSREFAEKIVGVVRRAMKGRKVVVYASAE